METIRCHMCGKDNLVEAEYCQYCNAKLVIANDQFVNQSESQKEESSDWLGNLREDSSINSVDDATETPSQDDSESKHGNDDEINEDVPDWLSKIRERNQTDNSISPKDSFSSGEEEPDQFMSSSDEVKEWLEQLKSQESEGIGETKDIVKPPDIEKRPPDSIENFKISPEKQTAQDNNEFNYLQSSEGTEDEISVNLSPDEIDLLKSDFKGQSEPTNEVFDSAVIDDAIQQVKLSREDTFDVTKSNLPIQSDKDQLSADGIEESFESSGHSEEEVEPPSFTPAFSGSDLPDWLGEFADSKDISEKDIQPIELQDTDGEGFSDWLSSLKDRHPEDFGKPFSPAFSLDGIEEESQPPEQVDTSGQPINLFKTQEETEQTEIPPGMPFNKDAILAESILPEDDEQTRPDSMYFDTLESETEDELTQGPLAGLRGVLPSESIVTQYKKPPVYSSSYDISEKQRIFASLLEHSLTTKRDGKEKVQKAPKKLFSTLIGVGLLLMLTITYLMSTSSILPDPALIPSYSTDFYDRIEKMPDYGTVLVGIEYEPGYSGELNPTAKLVIQHLLSNNSNIVFVSTIPAGPIIAENLVSNVIDDLDIEQATRGDFINLGYLAGGTASLKQFALDPQRTAPYSLTTPVDSAQPWDSAALKDINRIDDFTAVLFITEKFETSRSWIEQIQTELINTPMLCVSSAQIRPLLEPYYDSGQLQGLMAGLYGASVYEGLLGYTSNSSQHIKAYIIGILILIASIVTGIIIEVISGYRSEKAPKEE